MKQRNGSVDPLGEVIKKMLGEFSIEKKYDQTELLSSWSEIVGELIAKKTVRMFIKKDTLYIELSSAALKQEMIMSRSKVLERIKEKLGHEVVKEITFL